jgi:hypothetical protein
LLDAFTPRERRTDRGIIPDELCEIVRVWELFRGSCLYFKHV